MALKAKQWQTIYSIGESSGIAHIGNKPRAAERIGIYRYFLPNAAAGARAL